MSDFGVFIQPSVTAGTVARIELQNFLSQTNLAVNLGDKVNFLLGENGSDCLSQKFDFHFH